MRLGESDAAIGWKGVLTHDDRGDLIRIGRVKILGHILASAHVGEWQFEVGQEVDQSTVSIGFVDFGDDQSVGSDNSKFFRGESGPSASGFDREHQMHFIGVEHIDQFSEDIEMVIVERATPRGIDEDPVGVDFGDMIGNDLCGICGSKRHVHNSGIGVELFDGSDTEHIARDQSDTLFTGQLQVGGHFGKRGGFPGTCGPNNKNDTFFAVLDWSPMSDSDAVRHSVDHGLPGRGIVGEVSGFVAGSGMSCDSFGIDYFDTRADQILIRRIEAGGYIPESERVSAGVFQVGNRFVNSF